MHDVLSCVESNNVEQLKKLLDAGASPYETISMSPMHVAICDNRVECAKLLSEHMHPSDVVYDGRRSIELCVSLNRSELFKYFIQFEDLQSLRVLYFTYKFYVYAGWYEDFILRYARARVNHLEVLHMLPQLGLCLDLQRCVESYLHVFNMTQDS